MVFDKTGNIAAVYHKYNLWTSELPAYNIEAQPDLVYFDTNFGR